MPWDQEPTVTLPERASVLECVRCRAALDLWLMWDKSCGMGERGNESAAAADALHNLAEARLRRS